MPPKGAFGFIGGPEGAPKCGAPIGGPIGGQGLPKGIPWPGRAMGLLNAPGAVRNKATKMYSKRGGEQK